MGITSKGRITTRTVTAKPVERATVERVRIAKRDGITLKTGKINPGEGILIGNVWIVVHSWDRDRAAYSVVAPREIQVNHPIPVVLDS
jgi:hypothetical protein